MKADIDVDLYLNEPSVYPFKLGGKNAGDVLH